MASIISLAAFVLFVSLLVIAALTTARRVRRYQVARVEMPRLLGRDRDLLVGLAVPFVLILAARVLGVGSILGGQVWWILLTSLPPIYGVARYVYFEIWVIER